MTTVVTGAGGFLGSVLVRELVARGRSVRAIIRSNAKALQELDIEIVAADIRDSSSIDRALAGAESVFHLASVISLSGDRSGSVSATNIDGARNVAEAALKNGVKRFIHCSSIHVFDLKDHGKTINENTIRVTTDSPVYDRTKYAGEIAVRNLIKMGLPAVVIHPTGVIGPGDHRPSRMGQVLIDLSSKKLPALISGGFNWVDVRDVCVGALAAEEFGRIGESYILSGQWHSTRQLATFGEEITGTPPPNFDLPMWLAQGIAPIGSLLGNISSNEYRLNSDTVSALKAARKISSAKAETELGFKSRPIRNSVHDAYKWFEKFGLLKKPLLHKNGLSS
ncbi:MAG: NAD-dependent epimerase/dehydratase family protein [SAR202 cluster bacterium]|nr:MAG: NAD-dependent epimerase/dehydratase family protein [SAR202 cluster bacterium]